jgi:hypothetical protein
LHDTGIDVFGGEYKIGSEVNGFDIFNVAFESEGEAKTVAKRSAYSNYLEMFG